MLGRCPGQVECIVLENPFSGAPCVCANDVVRCLAAACNVAEFVHVFSAAIGIYSNDHAFIRRACSFCQVSLAFYSHSVDRLRGQNAICSKNICVKIRFLSVVRAIAAGQTVAVVATR